MARTLLVASQTGCARDWIRANLGGRDLLCLDPANADLGLPGRFALYRHEKCAAWRFYGSLNPQRAPHVLIEATARLAAQASDDVVIELFPFRPGPLRIQMARLCADLLRPDHILVDRRAQFDQTGWDASVEEIDLADAMPGQVQSGHRKARWLQMVEQSEQHEVDLRHVAIEGVRLGSGVPLPLENLRKYGFEDPLHAEIAGTSLFLVSDAPVEDVSISRALDATHSMKAVVVASKAYDNLLCAFAREGGEDFGIGRIESIHFPELIASVRCTAVAGAPVKTLRVGGLRIDAEGRELGELKPWEA